MKKILSHRKSSSAAEHATPPQITSKHSLSRYMGRYLPSTRSQFCEISLGLITAQFPATMAPIRGFTWNDITVSAVGRSGAAWGLLSVGQGS